MDRLSTVERRQRDDETALVRVDQRLQAVDDRLAQLLAMPVGAAMTTTTRQRPTRLLLEARVDVRAAQRCCAPVHTRAGKTPPRRQRRPPSEQEAPMTIGDKLRSRKPWLALLGAMLLITAQALTGEVGWQEATLASVSLLATYVLGQGTWMARPWRAPCPPTYAPADAAGE